MEQFLDTLNGGILAILAAFTIFLIVRLFQKRRSATWESGNIKLPVRRWMLAVCVLLAIVLVDKPIFRAISRSTIEASIPPTDPHRLSILIPDFQGTGGAEAADTISALLQNSLGTGVQIIRLPALPAGKDYGDAGKEVERLGGESLYCAARYNADVVVWGTYLPATQIVNLTYTAKGGSCSIPAPCGVVSSRVPRSFKLADAEDPTSEMGQLLARSAISSLTMAADIEGELAKPGPCLDDPNVARRYVTKAEALLSGNPRGLQGESLEVAFAMTAIFHGRLFASTNDMKEVDRSIELFEKAVNVGADSARRVSGALAKAIYERSMQAGKSRSALTDVAHLDRVKMRADPRDGYMINGFAGALLERAYSQTLNRADLELAEARYRLILRESSAADELLYANVRLFRLRAEALENAPGPENYRRAAVYRTRIYKTFGGMSVAELQQIPIRDRCTVGYADLGLERFRGDPDAQVETANRAASVLPLSELDWEESDCAAVMRRVGEAASRAYDLLLARDGTRYLDLLAQHCAMERNILKNDRTQSQEYNRANLAIALVKFAQESREGQIVADAIGAAERTLADAKAGNDQTRAGYWASQVAALKKIEIRGN
ncbi:MAG: hypothetical protein V4808_12530 [Pseudomonadota bacterium]